MDPSGLCCAWAFKFIRTCRDKIVNWGPAMQCEEGVVPFLRMNVSHPFAEVRLGEGGGDCQGIPGFDGAKAGFLRLHDF